MARPRALKTAASSLDRLARSLDLPGFLLPAFAHGPSTAPARTRPPRHQRLGARSQALRQRRSSYATQATEQPPRRTVVAAAETVLRTRGSFQRDGCRAAKQLVSRLEAAQASEGHWRPPRRLGPDPTVADVIAAVPSASQAASSSFGQQLLLAGFTSEGAGVFAIPDSPLSLADLAVLEMSVLNASPDSMATAPALAALWQLAWHHLALAEDSAQDIRTRAFAAASHFASAFGRVAASSKDPDLIAASRSLQLRLRAVSVIAGRVDTGTTVGAEASVVRFLIASLSLPRTKALYSDVRALLQDLPSLVGGQLDLPATLAVWDALRQNRVDPDAFPLQSLLVARLAALCEEDPSMIREPNDTRRAESLLAHARRSAHASTPQLRDARFRQLLPLATKLVSEPLYTQARARQVLMQTQLAVASSDADRYDAVSNEISWMVESGSRDAYLTASIVRAIAELPDEETRRRLVERLSWATADSLRVLVRDLPAECRVPGASDAGKASAPHLLAHAQSLAADVRQAAIRRDAEGALRSLRQLGTLGECGSPRQEDRLRQRQHGAITILINAFSRSAPTVALDAFSEAVRSCPSAVPIWVPTHLVGIVLASPGAALRLDSLPRLLTTIADWHRTRRRLGMQPPPPARCRITSRIGRKPADQLLKKDHRLLCALLSAPTHADGIERVRALVELLEAESYDLPWRAADALAALWLAAREGAMSRAEGFAWARDQEVWSAMRAMVMEAHGRQGADPTREAATVAFATKVQVLKAQMALAAGADHTEDAVTVAPLPEKVKALTSAPNTRLTHMQFFSPSLQAQARTGPAPDFSDQSLVYALCAVAAESFEGWWQRKVVHKLQEAESEALEEAKDEAARGAAVDMVDPDDGQGRGR